MVENNVEKENKSERNVTEGEKGELILITGDSPVEGRVGMVTTTTIIIYIPHHQGRHVENPREFHQNSGVVPAPYHTGTQLFSIPHNRHS